MTTLFPRVSGEARATHQKSIILVVPDLSSGGGVNRVATHLAGLFANELGYETTLINARNNGTPSYPVSPLVRLEQASGPQGVLAYFRTLLSLRRRQPDFVVSFWAQDNILVALALLGSRTRLVLCEHQSHFFPPPHVRLLRRIFYPLASRVLVLNRAELAHYSRFLNNVQLIPNPIVTAVPPVSRPREKLIIGVGHLIERKRFGDLLGAWAKSGLAGRGWRLAIIGEGPERPMLEERVRGIPGAELLGRTDNIEDWYRRASIVAITSDVEVFSLVLAEAALEGAVPVAYAADGPSFLLEDVPELLCPIGDCDRFADLLRALGERNDLDALNAKVRASIGRRMSLGKVTGLWRGLLSGLDGVPAEHA